MILPFSTQINGKPTLFPEKIMTGLNHAKIITWDETEELFKTKIIPKNGTYHTIEFDKSIITNPKYHTIREDKNDRWKQGMKIDFFINCRQKNMFRFAPVLPVVSVQEIFMTRRGSMLEITIAKVDDYIGGNDFQLDAFQTGELALNDGFDDYNDFRDYFVDAIEKNGKETGNYWFKGKIIHWTDKIY